MHVLYLCLFIFHVSYVKCNYKVLCFCEIPFHVQASSVFVTVTVFLYASVSVYVPVCVCVSLPKTLSMLCWFIRIKLLQSCYATAKNVKFYKCELQSPAVRLSVCLCVSLHVSKVSSIILFDICVSVCVLVSHLTLFCLLS